MKNKVLPTIIILVIIVGGGYFLINSGGGEKEIVPSEYDTFTQCLKDEGFVMYGSATCSQCKRQKREFGNSFHIIGEVECDPRNPDYVKGECLDDITHTPTWTQEDDGGSILFRFDSGFVKLEDLSEQSGCPLVKDRLEPA